MIKLKFNNKCEWETQLMIFVARKNEEFIKKFLKECNKDIDERYYTPFTVGDIEKLLGNLQKVEKYDGTIEYFYELSNNRFLKKFITLGTLHKKGLNWYWIDNKDYD